MLVARLLLVAVVCALGLYTLEWMKQAIRVAEKPLLIDAHPADYQRCVSLHEELQRKPSHNYDYRLPAGRVDGGIA